MLVYGAGTQGIAAARELFENPGTGLRPIGFVDDDPARTGQLVNGLPVLGRSYELDSLVATHGVKAMLVASSVVPPECQTQIATRVATPGYRAVSDARAARTAARGGGARRRGESQRRCRRRPPARRVPVATLSAVPRVPALESEPCGKCGGRNVRRSRAKGIYERFRKLHTPARLFRCDDCGWRGWLLPLEHAMPFDDIIETDEPVETDLCSLNTTFPPLAASAHGSHAGDARP